MPWLEENWHIAWAVLCLAAIGIGAMHFRRNPQAPGARAFFWLFPQLDPGYSYVKSITRATLVLWCVAFLIVVLTLLAVFLVPGFA